MSERDSELDALWRRHSREEPPAALDDAIRAAAHRAVHAKPATSSPRARAPWAAWTTLAAAASIGAIAVGVWQLQPRELDETKVVASDSPRRVDARREAAAPAAPSPRMALDGATPGAPSSERDQPLPQHGDAAREPAAVAREAAKPSPFPGASGNVAPSPRDAARPAQSAGARASTDNTQPAMAAQAPAASDLKSMPAPPAAGDANRPESTTRFAEPAAKRADSQAAGRCQGGDWRSNIALRRTCRQGRGCAGSRRCNGLDRGDPQRGVACADAHARGQVRSAAHRGRLRRGDSPRASRSSRRRRPCGARHDARAVP